MTQSANAPGPRLRAVAIGIAMVALSFANPAWGDKKAARPASEPPAADLPAITTTLRGNPSPESVVPFLPVLASAVYDAKAEALPLLEQAIEQSLPGAVETHAWPLVAESLKTAARTRFDQIEAAKAERHLQTLLALYRNVAHARRRDADVNWRWLRHLHEVVAEYLRGDQIAEALVVLAEGADLGLPYREEVDDGRAALAGALHRRLAQLGSDERYELLHEWTMPTKSRPALRVFSSLALAEAPPMVFARALGERPRSDSFSIAQIGGVSGLFSTAWSLVSAAAETGQLRRLTAELQTAADEKLPHADFVLLLAKITAADMAQSERLAAELLDAAKSTPPTPAAPDAPQQRGSRRLNALVLAAACLTREQLAPIGQSMLHGLLESAPARDPERLTPMLRRASAAATLKGLAALPQRLDNPNLELWVPVNGEFADDAARAAERPVWLAHEKHILHLVGPHHDYLCFRYPLTGEFQFQVEVQEGGEAAGGLAFGGLAFRTDAEHLGARLGNIDIGQERLQPFPFLRREVWPTFQRLAIQSADGAARFCCNGRPVWRDVPAASSSPWLALYSVSDAVTAFRGLHITGKPIIPRQVRLCDGSSLRGWFARYYPVTVSTAVQLAGEEATPHPAHGETVAIDVGQAFQPDNRQAGKPDLRVEFDWYAADGVIHGAHRPGGAAPTAAPAAPSRLSYFRPLANGDRIDYEFFYQPGQFAVHPALGRLAFLLDAGGVQLHWMTTGASDWTGLDERNTVVEPLNRRGPKPLPLKPGEWNRVTVALANDTTTISLNDGAVYVRKLEAENPRTFGFYYDRRQTAARIRNVVLRGDWPERLTQQQLADLTAPRDVALADSTRQALGSIFAERHVPDAALFIHRQAAAMPLEERFECLKDWVLPGKDHAGLRLALDFTPTHPAPPVADDHPVDARRLAQAVQTGASQVQTGGNLVAPALDLVEAARGFGKLDEVRRRVEQAPEGDDWSRRARLAMLAIVDLAREQPKPAIESLDKLLALVEAGQHTDFAQRWPETLATHMALADPAARSAGRDLAYHLLLRQVRTGPDGGSVAWQRQMSACAGVADYFDLEAEAGTAQQLAAQLNLDQWRPASRTTAKTRGLGLPCYYYYGRPTDARVEHLVGHGQDYLYFQSPLRGDFEVEYDVPGFHWRDTQLLIGGWWVSPIYDHKTYAYGNYLGDFPRRPIDPPLCKVERTIHGRTVVRDCLSRTYANGRLLHEQPLSEDFDPWIAIRNIGGFTGGAQNVRITGRPTIPAEICLSRPQLWSGWFAYNDGMPGGNDAWGPRADLSASGGIVGRRLPEFDGLTVESLLQYHRPVFEDGVIEYEFFYRQGDVECHPAIDRLAFLLEPTGMRIHWITDGVHDRTELAADNSCEEPACRRGSQELLLAANAWNKVALEFAADVVRLRLNGRLVYERTLEPTNQRTFGLFHYADRTEVLVRNVTWRGQWPRELPPVSRQELSGTYGDFLDARRAELKDSFQHDFARDGLPSDRFMIESQAAGIASSPASDGLHIAFAPAGGDRILYVAPRLTVCGDFDATVGFEALAAAPEADGKTLLILLARLDNSMDNECFLYRVAAAGTNATIDQFCQASIARRPDGAVRRDFSDRIMFEANAGRLRLARRGETAYFLVAENDSPNFRLLQTVQIGSQDLVHEGLRILTQMKGPGNAEVLWKSFEVRAERLGGPAVENWPQAVAELDRQRESLAGKFVHDFTRDELTVTRFHRWNCNPDARPAPGGLCLVARGTETWSVAGIAPHVAIRGDFDVTLDINETKFDPPKAGEKFSIFLQVELPTDKTQTHSSIFSVDDAGRRRALLETRVQKSDGGFDYRWPHQEPAEPFRRLRMARRGKDIYLLYSSDTKHPDRLLGRCAASDIDVADTGLRVTVHAGGAGRTAEVWLKQLSIRGEQLTVKPAVK